MDNFEQATQGVSSFVTAPDYIPTVLLQNATQEQVMACMEACRKSGKIYSVYLQTQDSDEEWVWRVQRIADAIIDAQNQDPVEFFNK